MTDTTTRPVPRDKAELVAWARESRAALDAAFARVPADQWTAPVFDGGRSPKDLLAHVAAWDEDSVRAMRQYGLGESLPPWEFAEAADITDLNARIFAKYGPWPLAEVQAYAAQTWDEMLAVLAALPDGRLSVKTEWGTIQGTIASNSYDHYPEHIAQLTAWLDAGR